MKLNRNNYTRNLFFFILAMVIAVSISFKKIIAAELHIDIINFTVKKGTLRAALFDKEKEFPRGKEIASATIKVREKNIKLNFKGLIIGKKYAVALYHDENDNDEFDKTFLGVPIEAFGFSRDTSVLTGTPTFKNSSFKITDDMTKITIRLKHSIFD